jgi:hypothetical protein
MMNRPPTAIAPVEKKTGCFEDHLKLLFLFSAFYRRAGGDSCLKTATPFHQAAKSIYLIPPIYGSQNTGAARLDYLVAGDSAEVFRRQNTSYQLITAQFAKPASEHSKFYIQTK